MLIQSSTLAMKGEKVFSLDHQDQRQLISVSRMYPDMRQGYTEKSNVHISLDNQ